MINLESLGKTWDIGNDSVCYDVPGGFLKKAEVRNDCAEE